MLAASGTSLDAVLELTVAVDEVVERLLKRAQIDGRADDTEDVIRHRLKVYEDETAPLAALYRQRGLLHQVDGMGEMDAVAERIQAVLATLSS
jgi:adenylate kinase